MEQRLIYDKELFVDSWVITMMLGASIFLGAIALFAFLWAIKNGQFDDEEKFLNAAKYDGVDELNDAVNQERKKEELKKSYRPE
jgi:cbb3-type cytochrome oxidase maturation protein